MKYLLNSDILEDILSFDSAGLASSSPKDNKD